MNDQSRCLTQEEASRYLQGRLTSGDDARVEGHLRECPSCLETISAVADSDTFVQTAMSVTDVDRLIEASTLQVTALQVRLRTYRAEYVAQLTQPAVKVGSGAEAPPWPADVLAPPRSAGEVGWIQHFRVLGQIGSGGMGVVYRAEDTKLKRDVAIKAILPKYADSKEARQRFLREARSAAHVVHANIVPIFHVDESNGFPFIVMPLLEGQSLHERMHSGEPIPLEDVWRIGGQIAQGLAAAHAKGLVHRDIKPANLWLENGSGGAVVKILDFGLARPSEVLLDPDDPKTLQGSVVGTPEYMSPQQARGENVDFRTDLYSLGVVLYRLATGQLPFSASTVHGYLIAHASETPKDVREINPAIPPSFGEMIMRLLEKSPARRVESAQVVADMLQDSPPMAKIFPRRSRRKRGVPAHSSA